MVFGIFYMKYTLDGSITIFMLVSMTIHPQVLNIVPLSHISLCIKCQVKRYNLVYY